MKISSYLCQVVGESPEAASRLHDSSIRRLKAFAIAIHLPVSLWAVSAYVIALQVFGLDTKSSVAIALLAASFIYCLERLVLATPKTWPVNLARIVIGFVIATLGSSMFDLVIFEREIVHQLRQSAEAKVADEFDKAMKDQRANVERQRSDWFEAQRTANCEANGTCGSGVRSTGPVYKQLARQTELLRQEYVQTQARLEKMAQDHASSMARLRTSPEAEEQAGLLARLEALHRYIDSNGVARMAWWAFFLLVLFLELTVVLAKLVFGETVDDQLSAMREELSHHKAKTYKDAITSPVASAQLLLDSSC
jgi:hypothetical protein